ncbi:MAG: GTPase [DPANN group archaeon]|nr:GTPase [DPANN group archaeon]
MEKHKPKKVIIMGAAGRDFHNFLRFYKDNPNYDVVAFTATQISGIEKRKFPKQLAGKLYKRDIPIYPEAKLGELIKKHGIHEVVFAYSDVSYTYVAEKSAVVNAAGADFILMGPNTTMIKARKPVISVCAVRTGSGKSQTSRYIVGILKKLGKKSVIIRHPMPYGDLIKQEVQRFSSLSDLEKHNATIEEREDYEHHIRAGTVVYAGVDYEKILKQAEKEADVIVWDGGNNDFPFYKPDLHVVVADPLRPGHELTHYPGSVNARMADVVVINKENSARKGDIETVVGNIRSVNQKALVVHADSLVKIEKPNEVKGKRVLIVEDGPTMTHGNMSHGAGYVIAKQLGCKIVDPRKHAAGSIKETFRKFTHLKEVLPAMGYSKRQLKELEATINAAPCDAVIIGTPIDLSLFMNIDKPSYKVSYELKEKKPGLLERSIVSTLAVVSKKA